MIKLFYATQNKGKQANMVQRLKDFSIQLLFPTNEHSIIEDGKSEVENAIIKARAYSNSLEIPVLAADSGMYFIDLESKSPQLFVNRYNGKTLCGEELVEHFRRLAKENGGRIKAYFKTGFALIVNKEIYTTEIYEEPFYIMEERSDINNRKMLDCISYSIKQNKYFSEFNEKNFKEEDKKFSTELITFLKKYMDL